MQAHPGGGAGPEPLQPAVKHEKLDKRSGAGVQEVPVKQVAHGTPPLGARRGLPRRLQPASSTSPWLFYQVLSEVFSKSSSVMSSLFKSLRLRLPTPEAYGKTADFGTLCISGSSQRLDPSPALLSSSDRSWLAALNVMLTPCPFQGFQGGCKGGPGGPEALQPAVNTKNETNVPELYVKPITQHPVLCAGGSSRTNGSRYPPLSARRGLPGWLQPASSTSPWLFYQVSSEVFSKSSSVMSSLLLL